MQCKCIRSGTFPFSIDGGNSNMVVGGAERSVGKRFVETTQT